MVRKNLYWFVSFLLIFPGVEAMAQVDSLRFLTGDLVVGEIKSLGKGILTVETDYSDSDFKIEWDKLTYIQTETQFLIDLSSKVQYYGTLHSQSDTTVYIITRGRDTVVTSYSEIVMLNAFNDKFSDRLSASISIGFDLTKAQNLQSLTTRSTIGYAADKWSLDAAYNTLKSTQDEVDDIQRSDGDITFRYVLPYRLYAISTLTSLSNTEQSIDLRMNIQAGLGTFLAQTNSFYWGAKVGLNRNYETFTNDTEDRQSWEGYFGTELNVFDMGDLDVFMLIMAYPSITAPGRWRSDSKIDIKYELPLDFFIKLGLSLNYDNQPADGASKTDYVFQTGFGWEW